MNWKKKKQPKGDGYLAAFNPEVAVAGSAPVGHGYSPVEPAWHEMCRRLKTDNTLESENVLFQHSVHEGKVYFLAARERDFGGRSVYASRLGAALPGGPAYQGDGAYLDTSTSVPALLIVRGESLAYRQGHLDVLTRIAEREALALIELDESHLAAWDSFDSLQAATAWTRLQALAYVGVFTLLVSLVSATVSLWNMREAEHREQANNSTAKMLKVQLTAELKKVADNPLGQQLRQLERVQNVALQQGGTVNYWKLDEKGVSFKVTLSAHVRPEDYAPLGALTAIDKQGAQLVLSREAKSAAAPAVQANPANQASAVQPPSQPSSSGVSQ